MITRLTVAIVPLMLAAVPAAAQEVGPSSPQGSDSPDFGGGSSITVGGGAVYMPDYEGSDHYRVTGAPLVIGSVKGFNFQVIGNRFSADLIPSHHGDRWDFQAGPVALWDFNRSTVSQIDDPRVRALGKRSSSIELGGYVGLARVGVITSPYDRLSVSLSYRKGVSGAQRGGVLTPSITYITPLSRKVAVGLFGSAERAERGYARAYFDVDAAGSAASGLPQFSTRGGWKNWSFGGFATVAVTGDLLHGFKLMAGGTYKKLMNDFADSPIVSVAGDKGGWLAGAGMAYTF